MDLIFLPRRSKFAIFDGRVTKKREKCKRKACFSFYFRVLSKFDECQSYEKSREEQNKWIYFFFRDGVSSPSLMAELRKKRKKSQIYLSFSECRVTSANARVTKSREQNKKIHSFFCRDSCNCSAKM